MAGLRRYRPTGTWWGLGISTMMPIIPATSCGAMTTADEHECATADGRLFGVGTDWLVIGRRCQSRSQGRLALAQRQRDKRDLADERPRFRVHHLSWRRPCGLGPDHSPLCFRLKTQHSERELPREIGDYPVVEVWARTPAIHQPPIRSRLMPCTARLDTSAAAACL